MRAARKGRAKIGDRCSGLRSAGRQRQSRLCPGLQATVQQTHVQRTGIQHQVRRAPGCRHIAPIQHDGGVMANPEIQQQSQQGSVRHLVPERPLLQPAGDQVSRGRDMCLRKHVGHSFVHLQQAPVPARGSRGFPARHQRGQPGRRAELLPACKIVAKLRRGDGGLVGREECDAGAVGRSADFRRRGPARTGGAPKCRSGSGPRFGTVPESAHACAPSDP